MIQRTIRFGKIAPDATVDFAVQELARYLKQMDPKLSVDILQVDAVNDAFKDIIWVGLDPAFAAQVPQVKDSMVDDAVVIHIEDNRGYITGANTRSVLLAVYRLLEELGCAWVRPGVEGERIPEKRIENISAESDKAQLSDALLEYESGFTGVGELEYSGKYSSVERERALRAPETETRRIAADFAGMEKDELVLEYEYRDSTLRCYSAGDALIYTDAERVRSMSRSRLVSETNISRDEAERLASDFLAERGFENVELASSEDAGALCRLRFIGVSEDVLLPDSEIRLSVALDDGSIYSFDASDYKEYDGSGKWNISYAEAAEKTPEGLKLADIRKVIIENAAGTAMPCYELRCTAEGDRSVNIYLDALSGTQTDIRIL